MPILGFKCMVLNLNFNLGLSSSTCKQGIIVSNN